MSATFTPRQKELMDKMDAKTITREELTELAEISKKSLEDCGIVIVSVKSDKGN